MKAYLRIPLQFLTLSTLFAVTAGALVTGAYFYVEPSLPSGEDLREAARSAQIPLRIYTRDGRLIQEIGEQKRTPVDYEDIPQVFVDAFLAAEDDRFFEHSGIDYAGILRGAWYFLTRPGERVPGGSTITIQVSRTHNLMSRDYNLVRKFREALLAFRIEREFDKEEILQLFLNTTFFGQRSNGIAAAARTYFNKDIDELTLGEVAIIAGIPQGPSIMNPYNSPENARVRRAYVLRRMRELGYIDRAEHDAALEEPIVSQLFVSKSEVEADYVAEMVRQWLIARYGDEVDEAGLIVTTTIDSRLQHGINTALRSAVESYDRSHGYRGPIARVELDSLGIVPVADSAEVDSEAEIAAPAAVADEPAAPSLDDDARIALDELLAGYPDIVGTSAAVVIASGDTTAHLYLRGRGLVAIGLDAVSWAGRYVNENYKEAAPARVADALPPGDLVRLKTNADGELELAQLPDVNGALVSVDPRDGAIVALIGGYSYAQSSYNRAAGSTRQAAPARQPGSSMKPFIYSAAFEHGYTPATILDDIPITLHSPELEDRWSPQNYEGQPNGEVPLRRAIVESMNLAAIRTVMDVGPRTMIPHLRAFGFGDKALKTDATLALGSGGVSPTELAGAYAVFANGGYRVPPYFIDRVETPSGEVLYDARRSLPVVCAEAEVEAGGRAARRGPELIAAPSELFPQQPRCAERAISARNAYLITDILKDVVRYGSGQRAWTALRRADLAGKTGTTDGPRDAWFAGFNADIVAVAWIGFDDERLLGTGAQGGRTAIPAWIDYMRVALDGMPQRSMPAPPGIVEIRINPTTGLRAHDLNQSSVVWEIFDADNIPDYEAAPFQPGLSTPEPGAGTRLFE